MALVSPSAVYQHILKSLEIIRNTSGKIKHGERLVEKVEAVKEMLFFKIPECEQGKDDDFVQRTLSGLDDTLTRGDSLANEISNSNVLVNFQYRRKFKDWVSELVCDGCSLGFAISSSTSELGLQTAIASAIKPVNEKMKALHSKLESKAENTTEGAVQSENDAFPSVGIAKSSGSVDSLRPLTAKTNSMTAKAEMNRILSSVQGANKKNGTERTKATVTPRHEKKFNLDERKVRHTKAPKGPKPKESIDAEKMYLLARDYYNGTAELRRNRPKARELLLRIASRTDHAETLLLLGEMSEKGISTKKDMDEAINWYMKVADLGNAEAFFALGTIYLTPDIDVSNLVLGVNFLRSAASLNHAPSLHTLGVLYESGLADEEAEALIDLNIPDNEKETDKVVIKQNYAFAIQYYKRAIQLNYLFSYYRLGLLLFRGLGCKQNKRNAFLLWKRAGERKEPNSIYMLSKCFRDGEVVGKDEEKGFSLCKQAALLGSGDAANELGEHFLAQGKHLQALEVFENAGALGNGRAFSNLGQMYENGTGVNIDVEKAIASYHKAEALKDPFALYRLGVIYYPIDLIASQGYFEGAVRQGGVPEAACELAMFYLEGLTGQIDEVKAFHLLTLAAENDVPDAYLPLVDFNFKGLPEANLEPSIEAVKVLIIKAASLPGNKWAVACERALLLISSDHDNGEKFFRELQSNFIQSPLKGDDSSFVKALLSLLPLQLGGDPLPILDDSLNSLAAPLQQLLNSTGKMQRKKNKQKNIKKSQKKSQKQKKSLEHAQWKQWNINQQQIIKQQTPLSKVKEKEMTKEWWDPLPRNQHSPMKDVSSFSSFSPLSTASSYERKNKPNVPSKNAIRSSKATNPSEHSHTSLSGKSGQGFEADIVSSSDHESEQNSNLVSDFEITEEPNESESLRSETGKVSHSQKNQFLLELEDPIPVIFIPPLSLPSHL
jgi:TPR repeat protein